MKRNNDRFLCNQTVTRPSNSDENVRPHSVHSRTKVRLFATSLLDLWLTFTIVVKMIIWKNYLYWYGFWWVRDWIWWYNCTWWWGRTKFKYLSHRCETLHQVKRSKYLTITLSQFFYFPFSELYLVIPSYTLLYLL